MQIEEHIKYKYIAIDGKVFDDEIDCLKWENTLQIKNLEKLTTKYQQERVNMLAYIKNLESILLKSGIQIKLYKE